MGFLCFLLFTLLSHPILLAILQYNFTLTQQYLAQDGVYKSVKVINGQSPGPTIIGDENDWVNVTVYNHLENSITFHFHGLLQLGTPWADGVPGVTQTLIPRGGIYTYMFQFKNQSGALWYHSHYRGYLSDGLYGMIYIRPAPERERPYHLLTNDTAEQQLLYDLERDPQNLVADDIFKHNMDDVIARMFDHNVDPICIQSILINGKGRVYCHPQERFRLLAARNPHLKTIPEFDSMGCVSDESFTQQYKSTKNNYALELPGCSPPCKPTMRDNYVYYTHGNAWQYVNFLNAGGQYTKAFSIDDHPFFVIAVDGVFVIPREVKSITVPVGSRVTICFKTDPNMHEDSHRPFAIRAAAVHTPQYIEAVALLLYGSPGDIPEETLHRFQELEAEQTGERYQDLDGKLWSNNISPTWPHHFFPHEQAHRLKELVPANTTFHFSLRRFDLIKFTMFEDRTQLHHTLETSYPLLYRFYEGDCSTLMESDAYLQPMIRLGETVDLIVNNHKFLNHPVHLHGHYFHILSFSDHENFPYASVAEAVENNYGALNIDNPPYSDVAMVAVGGHVVLRIYANNPGIWLFHCHNIGHLLGGMGAVLFESLSEIPPPPEYLQNECETCF